MNGWVETGELDAGIGGGELPADAPALGVAGGEPGSDLLGERLVIGDTRGQALAGQDAELDLGDVQPTAVLGRVMELQLGGEASGFGGREGLIERGRGVGVEVV